MNIIGRRKLWFAISLGLVIPGLIALFIWGLKPGIDFTGGQEMEIKTTSSQDKVRKVLEENKAKDITITPSGEGLLLIRYSDKGGGLGANSSGHKIQLAECGGYRSLLFIGWAGSQSRHHA